MPSRREAVAPGLAPRALPQDRPGASITWSGWPDLNRWPLRPEANARCGLPSLLLCLTCLAPSVDVRWCPLVSVAVVTHLVTHPPRGAVVVATGLGHQPRTGLAMPDVVRRLVERRAAQLVVAAAAGDQEMTHTPALRRCFRTGVQMQGFHPTVCRLPGARE